MLRAKVGSFVKKSDATGNQSVTGVGFAPQLVFFFGNARESDGAHADARMFLGVADFTASEPGEAVCLLWKDNLSTTIGNCGHSYARMELHGDANNTITSQAALVPPLESDGFTINWSTQDSLPRIISYLAIGGDEIVNSNTYSTNVGTATGNQNTSGLGFQPNFLMMFNTCSSSSDNSVSIKDVWGGFGAASSTSERAYMSFFAQHNTAAGSAGSTRKYQQDKMFGQITSSQRIECDLTSFNVNGYSLNWGTHDGYAAIYQALALAGGNIKVGTFTQRPSTGEQTVAGFSFRPKGVLFFSAETIDSTIYSNMQNVLGFADATEGNASVWWGSLHQTNPSVADSYLDRTKAVKFMTPGTPTLTAEASMTVTHGDSFVLDWTTTDFNARQIGYIAFGEEIQWGLWSETRSFTLSDQSPTVVLDDPNDGSVISDATPALSFTGTDREAADIRYNIQVWSGAADWYDLNWPYRVRVTVLSSKVEENITDFPIYLNLNNLPSGFHTNVNQTDGRDIRVTQGDGVTEVPREVVYYTAASDAGELHFKGDIQNGTDVDFYVYYGNTSATDYAVDHMYGANNVWDSQHRAVYHLNQDPSSSTMTSSTANNRPLTAVGMASNQKVAAKVGNGIDFIPNDYLYAADDDVFDIAGSYSLSAWINLDTTPSTGKPVIIKIGESTYYHNYYMDVDSGRRLFTGHFNGSTWVETPHTTNTQLTTNGTTWYLVSGVYDSAAGTITSYVNGVQDSQLSSVTGTPATSTQQFQVFAQSTAPMYLDGKGDEVRVSTGVRSANYFKTQYNNQNDASSFFLIGAQEALSAAIDKTSGTDSGFSGTPDNSDPFTSGQQVTYTVQSGDELMPRNLSLTVSQLGYLDNNAMFGSTSSPNLPYRGQTFQVPVDSSLAKVEIMLLRVNSPTDAVYVEIYTNNNNAPGVLLGTSLNQKTGSTLTPSSPGELVEFIFMPEILLSANTTYWFVIKRTGATDNVNHYRIDIGHNGSVDPYSSGKLYAFINGAWAADDDFDGNPYNDAYFRIFTGYNGAYFWHVRGVDPDGNGNYGSYSATNSFIVVRPRRRNFPLWV